MGFRKGYGKKQVYALSTFLTSLRSTMFTAPTDAINCQISRFYISDTTTTTEVTTAGYILTHLFWNAKANTGDALTVYTSFTGSFSRVIDFRIQVVLGTAANEFLNPQSYSIQLKLGCFQETQLLSIKTTTHNNNWYHNNYLSNATHMHNEFPPVTAPVSYQTNIYPFLFLNTGDACGIFKATMYTDEAMTILADSSSAFYPLVNPMSRDEATGQTVMNVMFNYDQTTTSFPTLYMKFETQESRLGLGNKQTLIMKMTGSFCSQTLQQKSPTPLKIQQSTSVQTANLMESYFSFSRVNLKCMSFTYQIFNQDYTPNTDSVFWVSPPVNGVIQIKSLVPYNKIYIVRVTNKYVNVPPGPLNEQQIEVVIRWQTTLCNTQNLLPIYQPGLTEFQLIVQKNSGEQPFGFTFTNTYFTAPTKTNCNINDWIVSKTATNTVLVATDSLFPYFTAVAGFNTSQVKVNTQMITDGYMQLTARVWPKIGEDTANMLNPTPAMIKFSIGCIVAPIVAEVSGQTNLYFSSLTSTKASFILPKPQSSTSTISINLNEAIEFKTNDTFCKVQQLSSFSEAGGVYTITDSTSETKLVTNPTIRTAGALSPVLEVVTDSSKTSIRSVFIKAETEGIAGASVGVSQFEMSFAYCDVTPLLSQAELKYNLIRGEKPQKVSLSSLYTLPPISAICNGLDFLLSSTDTTYSSTSLQGVTLSNSELVIDPTTVMPLNTLYLLIRSTTSSKHAALKFQLSVKDCSAEVVTPIKATSEFTITETNQVVLLTKTQVVDMFSAPTDSRCAISDWQLTTIESQDQIVGGEYFEMFTLSAKQAGVVDLKFDPQKNTQKKSEIKVRLWAVIGPTALSTRMIDAPIIVIVLQPQFAVSLPPVFKSTPVTLLKVKATRDVGGRLEESPSISFPSPQIEDPFGLTILVDAKWIGKTPEFASLVSKTNMFEIVVDRTKIGESGTYSLSVQLGNQKCPTGQQSATIFSLVVTFQQDRLQTSNENTNLQTEQQKQPEQAAVKVVIKPETIPESKPEIKQEPDPKPNTQQVQVPTNNKQENPDKPKEDQELPDAKENELVPIVQVPVQRGGVAKQPKKSDAQQVVSQEYMDEVLGRWKQKTRKNEDKKSYLPLALSPKFTRESIMIINSNQKMVLPPFANNAAVEASNERNLIELSEIDVTRDLFEIEFDFYDLAAEEKIEYSVSLSNWTSDEIILQFNFTNPNLVSKGLKQDKVFLKARDPQLFRSAESDEIIDQNSREMVSIVPTQLPFGIKAESLESVVSTTQKSLFAILILQIVMQYLLKKSAEQILTFYITLQQMTYVIHFNIKIAAPVEMFLLEMQKLIEFQNLNLDSIIQIWYPEFSLDDWVQGYKERIVSEEQGMSILKQLQVFVLAVIVYGLVILVMWIASRYKQKIKQKLKATLKSTFWTGSILSFDMQCMADCIVVGNQIRMVTTHSEFLKQEEVDAAIAVFCCLNFVVVVMICYLLRNRNKLDSKEMKEKCGQLYILPLSRSNHMALFRVPFSVWQRLIYMVLAGAFYEQPYFSLQLYVFLNLWHTMYRIHYKLDAPLGRRFQQHFSDVVVHFMFLMLFLFTDYVSIDEAQMACSLIYMGLFGVICLVNVIVIAYHAVKQFILRRKRDRILKLMKTQILEMQKMNLNANNQAITNFDIFKAYELKIKNKAEKTETSDDHAIKRAVQKLKKAKTSPIKIPQKVQIVQLKLLDMSQSDHEDKSYEFSTTIQQSEVRNKDSTPNTRSMSLENQMRKQLRSQIQKSYFYRDTKAQQDSSFQLKIIKK